MPWTEAHQAPLSLGFPRQEYWSGLSFPSPGDLPTPGFELKSLVPPALAVFHCATWETLYLYIKACKYILDERQFSIVVTVQSLSRIQLFAPPWTAARQASLSFTISQSLLKLMSIESLMPSNLLILCRPPSPPALNLSQHQGLFQWVNLVWFKWLRVWILVLSFTDCMTLRKNVT